MFNKLYEKVLQYIKENIMIIIFFLCLLMLIQIKLPYYIYSPGGLINVSERINIEDSYPIDGSLNLAYVLEFKSTIPTILYALVNPNWDIYKKEEVVSSNETVEEILFRDKLMLEEANQNALYVGFTKANKKVEIKDEKVYVGYVDTTAKTDLKIGDQIIKVNDYEVSNKENLYDIILNFKEGDKLKITVINNDKTYTREATLQKIDDRVIIGIVLIETKEVITPNKTNITFKKSESGPSGGFMMALAIYDYLTEYDLTKGLNIVGTGTIDMNGNVGSIGGVEYKIKAAVREEADIFFVPSDNYEEALEVVKENKFDIELVSVGNIDEAIEYLKSVN